MNLYNEYIASHPLAYAAYHLVFYVIFWLVVYNIADLVAKRSATVAFATKTKIFNGLYASLAVADVCTALYLKGFAAWWILGLSALLYAASAWGIFVITLLVKDAKKTGELTAA